MSRNKNKYIIHYICQNTKQLFSYTIGRVYVCSKGKKKSNKCTKMQCARLFLIVQFIIVKTLEAVLRWWRNRTGRPLSRPQIRRKNI